MDLPMVINGLPSLIEQLSQALQDLASHADACIEKGLLKDIEEHFRKLEASVVERYLELEIREKAFKEQESDAHLLIASQEADIAVKEQNLWDQLQELKDAAVSAIVDARADHQLASLEHTDGEDNIEVSSTLGEKNAVHSGSEVKSPQGVGENADGFSGKDMKQLCEQMDAKGILFSIMKNKKNLPSITEDLCLALEGVTEPCRLVLASLELFYSHDESNTESETEKSRNAAHSLRQACVVCMEALATVLAKAQPGADHLVYPEIKQQAKVIADEWKPKLATASTDTPNSTSLETRAFLQLLATFRIASEFDEEELCKLVLAVAHCRQVPELCRSLGLAEKMPGVVETLINDGKQIEAARFIYTFQLTETFPLVPLLKGYLRDLRRNAQGKPGQLGNSEELTAVRAVVRCIREFKLGSDYPLDPLQRRITQLQKAVNNDKDLLNERKRPYVLAGREALLKKQREARIASHAPVATNILGQQPPSVYPDRMIANNPSRPVPSFLVERATYTGLPEKYNYHATAYDYQAPSQPTYPQQPLEQRSYYYSPGQGITQNPITASLPSSYGNYAGLRAPGTDETNANPYTAPVSSGYGNYAGSGMAAPHQPYM